MRRRNSHNPTIFIASPHQSSHISGPASPSPPLPGSPRRCPYTPRRHPRGGARGERAPPPLKPPRWLGACPRGRRRPRCRPSTSSAGAPSLPFPPPAPAPRPLPRPPTPSAASPHSWVTALPLLPATDLRPAFPFISFLPMLWAWSVLRFRSLPFHPLCFL